MNNSTQRYEVPGKCILISEEGFLDSTYMKTGKVLTTAVATALLCFISLLKFTTKAQGLEVFGEGKGAVMLFYMF